MEYDLETKTNENSHIADIATNSIRITNANYAVERLAERPTNYQIYSILIWHRALKSE